MTFTGQIKTVSRHKIILWLITVIICTGHLELSPDSNDDLKLICVIGKLPKPATKLKNGTKDIDYDYM